MAGMVQKHDEEGVALIRKIDIAEDVDRSKPLFIFSAIALTLLSEWLSNIDSTIAFLILLPSAIAAGILWIFVIDWLLTPKCPRCGTILRGVRAKTVTRKTRLGTGHFLVESYRCPRCKLRDRKERPLMKPINEKKIRTGIHRYWRF